jgi:hypothetical protein
LSFGDGVGHKISDYVFGAGHGNWKNPEGRVTDSGDPSIRAEIPNG